MDVADTKIEHEFLVGRVRKIEVLIANLTSLDVRVLVGVGIRKTRPQMSIDVTCVREMDPKTIKQIIFDGFEWFDGFNLLLFYTFIL